MPSPAGNDLTFNVEESEETDVAGRLPRSRLAHLLAEMAVRYAQVGMFKDGGYPLPITQEQIADALGLTSVHVNRSVRALREAGLIHMSRSIVQILDWNGLIAAGEFTPDYLHLPRAAAELRGTASLQVR